jgi:hypothetical protein
MPGNRKIMTTLKTFKALINGTLVTVDQLKGNDGRQDIRYKLHRSQYTNQGWVIVYEEQTLSADNFWKLNPQIS